MTQGGDFLALAFQSLDNAVRLLSFMLEIFIDEEPDLYSFAGERPRRRVWK